MPTQLWFHEQMTGYFAKGEWDPRAGYEEGKKTNTTFGFDLTIFVDDLDAFIANPNHKASVTGHYLGNLMPGDPPVSTGSFNFMSQGPGGSRLMEHHHSFSWQGKTFHFDGEKDIVHSELTFDQIVALTTLYSRISDENGKPYAAGVLIFPVRDILKLITSFHTRGTDDDFTAKMKFLKFFLSEEAWVILSGWKRPTPPANLRRPLAREHSALQPGYDVVIVGSGYGGGVAAARLSAWEKAGAKKSVCVLERGKEWRAGEFPDEPQHMAGNFRSPLNPDGLFEFHHSSDIDVFVGSGLGGTSLINANVMIHPDAAVFSQPEWPQLPSLEPYYVRAANALRANLDPEPPQKSIVFREAAKQTTGSSGVEVLPIAVTFGKPAQVFERADAGLTQTSCIGCGGCVTGCNFTSKNTVDMTYLAVAEKQGAAIFTSMEVQTIERKPNGTYTVRCRDHVTGAETSIDASQVIVSAGVMGSFKILSRSRAERGLPVSDALGTRFSGNGDVLGFGYNNDALTYTTNGPTISSVAHFGADNPAATRRFIIEEGGVPQALMVILRGLLPLLRGREQDTNESWVHHFREWVRVQADNFGFQQEGALNHSLMYLGMGTEESAGKMHLVGDNVNIAWPGVAGQPFAKEIDDKMYEITGKLGGTYVRNPEPRSFLTSNLITVHPLGGCPMGTSAATGVVNSKGEVFGHEGGLYVTDGSIIPTSLGVNPALTITAISEYIVEQIAKNWSAP